MCADTPERDDEENDPLFDPAWEREVNGYGTFRRGKDTEKEDKQLEERGFVEDALTGGGFTFSAVCSPDADPPDCTAIVDGASTGIEVVELVDGPLLGRMREALRQSPTARREYRVWTREDFLKEVQGRIEKKNHGKWKGGPYQRHMLVIHTDEMTLDRDTVGRFLEGEWFAPGFFTDVVLVLSYDPHTQTHPTFRLALERG